MTVVAALLLVLGLLMAAPAWAQSGEGTMEETAGSVEDAAKEKKAEKKSDKDDDISTAAQTSNASATAGGDEQQAEDDTTTATTDGADVLSGLTAAEVSSLSCAVVEQYVREVANFNIAGDQYSAFSALELRAIECERGDVILATVPGGKLPITGGLPLMGGGALLGVALIGTGISIVRARRG